MLRISVAALFALTACGPRAATVVDQRPTYIEEIADTICNEKDSCGEIGPDGDFASYEACQDEVEGWMRDIWPDDQCAEDSIDAEKYLDCTARAELIACDTGFFDLISAASECNADEVCID